MPSQKTRLAAFLFAVISLAGCATKSPPGVVEIRQQALTNVTLPSTWKAGKTSVSTNPDIADNWLATFNDEQLDTLVLEAIANNPDLRIAATKVEQAEHYVRIARAALRPSVMLAGTGGIKAGGSGDVSTPIQGVMIGASWEPDLWGRLRYGRNAAQAQHASALADFEFARQSIAATTARSWFTATETLLQRQISEEMTAAARELLSLSVQRQRVGVGSEQEVAVARANLSSFEDTTAQNQLAHQQTLRALELLLGRYPAAELRARSDLGKLSGPIPIGMPLAMLERRPDLLAAERRVAAAFNRVGEAKAARLPRLILNISGGAISSEVLELKPDFENPTFGAGARLIAPIYQGGALKAQVLIRTAEQKQAVAEYGRAALRALSDVETALAASQTLAEREPLLQQNLADNQRALQLTQEAYRVGKADLRAVQQQQLDVHAARLALLHVQSEQLTQRVNLHLALGGGWEQPPMNHASSEQRLAP
jgi:NodT family efflux transporter outer membrane factor (OMF) lipoprotein